MIYIFKEEVHEISSPHCGRAKLPESSVEKRVFDCLLHRLDCATTVKITGFHSGPVGSDPQKVYHATLAESYGSVYALLHTGQHRSHRVEVGSRNEAETLHQVRNTWLRVSKGDSFYR